jgi:small subunit ribosomal protein S9
MSVRYYEAVGRRKTSSARVRLYPGTGTIVVNERPVSEYFPRETDQLLISRPLQTSDTVGNFNISIRVEGGGLTGQAGAAALGIARALCTADENLRPVLKKNGFLVRDSRAKERKKYGLKRARKAPQYTKR